MPKFDVIIVGSGLAGLHSACAVISEKISVAIIDVGFDESDVLENSANVTFEDVRRYDASQYKTFLGEDLSGIPVSTDGSGHSGNMTSGRRGYVSRGANEFLPIKSKDAVVLHSLAKGGLSEAWGAVCGFFNDDECRSVGLPPKEMLESYKAVIQRIGVSGPSEKFVLQGPAVLDDNAKTVLRNFELKKEVLDRLGFSVEQPPLALLTEDMGQRKKTEYRDMDFWDNVGRSIYRGHYTLEELKKHRNFTYLNMSLVTSVQENKEHVIVHFTDLRTKHTSSIEGRCVIMAAGAIDTTRLLLQSFNLFDKKVPILIKDNYILPSVSISRLGKTPDKKRHSLCQLTMHDSKKSDGMTNSYVQLYSYNSLLLHKLIQYAPLPKPEALSVLSLVAPSIMLADLRFSSGTHNDKLLSVSRNESGSSYVEITCLHADTENTRNKDIQRVKKALRRLGLWAIKVVRNPFGAAAHYAGGVPFSEKPHEHILSVDARGMLHNTKRIFVADSASWRTLPAKPPGLTIMANADRIGRHVRSLIEKSTV